MAHLIDPMPEATQEEANAASGGSPENRPNSKEIDHFDRQEQECLELAFDIAVTDPTEEDHLRHGAASISSAWRRLGDALGELLVASLAMVAALAGRLMLASAARVVRPTNAGEQRPLGDAQSSVYSLHLLMKLMAGRLAIPRTLILLMLGGRRRTVVTDADGHEAVKTVSSKLAERRYQPGLTLSGFGYGAKLAEAQAADTPLVRVLLGVSVGKGGLPVYRVRRFVKNREGRYDEVAGYRSLDPDAAYRAFASNPALNDLEEMAGCEQTDDRAMTTDSGAHWAA